ncbi:TetR/AcrR family transcriptional regulator [Gymnodinialimonas sp. 2305UL16-5]|uniref:TetR/AcrR family transcriptional regulator n=1 Tax=Gymnodinialimonas mytili TaxID=3126503 RepID=UPI0030AFE7EC
MNKRNKSYHHGDLKQALLDEALRHIRAEGIESLSLRACSKAVQVSPGAAFRHFKDKRELATAIAAHGYRLMCAAILEYQSKAEDTEMAQFRAVGEGYVAFALNEPNLFHLMFAPGQLDSSDEHLKAQAAKIPMFSREGSGPLGVGDMLVWGVVHGLSELAIQGHFKDSLPGDFDGKMEKLTQVMAAVGPSLRALSQK